MAKTTKRGRPQLYPLTGNQIRAIEARIIKGQSASFIAEALGVHEYAVLRVRRAMA
jgi:hypothetical protein